MKHIRNILLLITIIFAFVMQAEVYQNMTERCIYGIMMI